MSDRPNRRPRRRSQAATAVLARLAGATISAGVTLVIGAAFLPWPWNNAGQITLAALIAAYIGGQIVGGRA